jgi:hypothetical protein
VQKEDEMKTMILSVAHCAETEEVTNAVLVSDQVRRKTLDACYAIPGYADLSLEEKNRIYDKVKEDETVSYYTTAFEKLIGAGVPRWYIRLYLLTEIIYFSRVYVYYNPHDVETKHGWYATNGICIVGSTTEADKNRKCYGELKSLGFPTWDEYKLLFEGDEYDSTSGFMNAYDRHQEEWLKERARESRTNYA